MWRWILLAIATLSILSPLAAQPWLTAESDTWNSMWLGTTSNGTLGSGPWPCTGGPVQDPYWPPAVLGCEMPGGSRVSYLGISGLWIGAIIDSAGVRTPRVSTATDYSVSPSLNEIWSGYGATTVERSMRDTVGCGGVNIYSPTALADHELEMVMTDTLTDPTWVRPDPVSGPHRPLGVRITRTLHSSRHPSCNRIYWIRYRIENISLHRLVNLYLGHLTEPGVGAAAEYLVSDPRSDDLAGFEPGMQIAYTVDNDGRYADDPEGGDLSAPHIAGFMFLPEPGFSGHVSFNWWAFPDEYPLDSLYGPSWVDGPAWEAEHPVPQGDLERYQFMANRQIDFDQLHTADQSWIDAHPQGTHAWRQPRLEDSTRSMIANGAHVRTLFSIGPLGQRWYQDQNNEWVTKLDPGESFDCWMVIVGGQWFHNPDRPQPTSASIDPSLFNYDDLLYRANIAASGLCVAYSDAASRAALPGEFTLAPVYPNPFNAAARVRLTLHRAMPVTLTAYDVLGREAQRLHEGLLAPGEHELTWDASTLPSGLYFLKASADGRHQVRKAVLLK